MRYFFVNMLFLWMMLVVLSETSPIENPHTFSADGSSTEIASRQLGPIGLTILGAVSLPILIPVGVARLVSRLTNLGNSTSATGVTVRPVILPNRPLRLPLSRSLHSPVVSTELHGEKVQVFFSTIALVLVTNCYHRSTRRMRKHMMNQVLHNVLIIILLLCKDVFCKPAGDDLMSSFIKTQTEITQPKQFIGSSVIGGLMWPVLLTLTSMAIMARIPDFFQRIFTGTGGYRSKRSDFQDDHLNELLKLLETSLQQLDKTVLEDAQANRNHLKSTER
ncbi:hypothetical protein HNY73_010827 [Argiope bruennichi]|uniref:Uncharacterized protein n=1 Tax=Argiope bruennichi TaxID=94029 RepID=A0A8T0F4P5_ARGBR|nr:hypothetical protein HNY73_010827 [Argiope bruennichi]